MPVVAGRLVNVFFEILFISFEKLVPGYKFDIILLKRSFFP